MKRTLRILGCIFGTLYSMNITNDPEYGIGKWTDGELYYFLRTGIHTDGRWSPPYMPKFPLMHATRRILQNRTFCIPKRASDFTAAATPC